MRRVGEKPDGAPTSIRRDVRRETWRDPWNFSLYLRFVYHKALSGTYQKIHWSVQKVLAFYPQEDFWLENAYIKGIVVRDV